MIQQCRARSRQPQRRRRAGAAVAIEHEEPCNAYGEDERDDTPGQLERFEESCHDGPRGAHRHRATRSGCRVASAPAERDQPKWAVAVRSRRCRCRTGRAALTTADLGRARGIEGQGHRAAAGARFTDAEHEALPAGRRRYRSRSARRRRPPSILRQHRSRSIRWKVDLQRPAPLASPRCHRHQRPHSSCHSRSVWDSADSMWRSRSPWRCPFC